MLDLVDELNLQNITERRNYFLCNLMFKHNPRKIWEELKSVLPVKINFKSIPKNLNADTFNKYFVEAPQNLDLKFSKEPGDLYWKGPESIHAFRFKDIIVDDVILYSSKLPDKSGGNVLGFDIKRLRVAAPYISEVFSIRVLSCWLEICKGDTSV